MNRIGSITFLLSFLSAQGLAQTSSVNLSSFGMGFGIGSSANSTVIGSVGEPTIGVVEGQNTRIESGFVNNAIIRSGNVTVTVQSEVATLGRSVGLRMIVPANLQTFAESLFFRKGGEQTFSRMALARVGDTLAAAIPATATTIRGVEYFFTVLSNLGLIRFPTSGVDTMRVNIDTFASPTSFQSRIYRMISVPAELSNSSVLSVLEDDFGSYDPNRWRVFRWENNRYVEFPAIRSRLTPGTAFWLVTHGGLGFGIENAKSVPSLQPIPLVLDTGWNQIANPFAFRVSMNSVTSSGQVSDLYFFAGESHYVPNVNVMEPWEGYFIENRSGESVVLSVLPVEASPAVPKANEPVFTGNDYRLQLSAELEQSSLKDIYNYVGFVEGSSRGDDMLDQRKPPPIGDHVQLSIEDGRSYLSNFKPPTRDGECWNFGISSTIPDRHVFVKLTELGTLPEGFNIYILDRDDFNAVPIVEQQFSIEVRESRRSLKLIIGTEKYAEENNEGIPLVPVAYALNQNFPNPFNPTTTIRYHLNKRSNVNLEVFNLLGQRVKTLVSTEQVTGTYSVVWNGESETGIQVSSGVYFYRLRAGDFVQTRKMMLVR